MSDHIALLIATVIIMAIYGLSFVITAGLVYGVCWSFGWPYSHKIALGVWMITLLVKGVISGGKSHE